MGPSEPLPDASNRVPSGGNRPSGDVDCTDCGCAFTSAGAYDKHRPGSQCLKPTSVGLVVACRVRITWSTPIRVPVAFDLYGGPTEFVDADPETAGQWDERCWRDHP